MRIASISSHQIAKWSTLIILFYFFTIDLKPANILLVGSTWKLADFGIARALGEAYQAQSASFGTLEYAPPEAYTGTISSAWDIWSFGVVMLEVLTGRYPFPTDESLLNAILHTNPVLPVELPPYWAHIIRGCLEKDPARRWSAAQVKKALEQIVPPSLVMQMPDETQEDKWSVVPVSDGEASPGNRQFSRRLNEKFDETTAKLARPRRIPWRTLYLALLGILLFACGASLFWDTRVAPIRISTVSDPPRRHPR